ncbi:MAG: type IV toxin-antitoxin system AbiEi family antitoxin domain-containing protein [Prevotellaceae bacterium]|nr:type IV toxin-antitoxin system AbiEi family antitoxin domain-containing protein [Prevotellaceae bacterium]
MDCTIEYKIFERMKKAKRGVVFFTVDFTSYGSSKTCNKALERLAKQGKIMRIGRGIYTIPRKSRFFGHVTPSIETIAQGIARRDKARIIPTGLFSENLLGLSTQVPMKIVYLTDGAPRELMIGDIPLVFKKTSPKNLSAYGKISGLVIQALKSITKDKVTEDDIEKVINHLKNENPQYLVHDIKLAPEWIREIMRKVQIDNNI